jgi:hypothetical protein
MIQQAPRSSYISLSGKTPQSRPQIRYNLSLKSAIPDKVMTRDPAGGVTCFAGTGTDWDCTPLSFTAMNSTLDYRGVSKCYHKYLYCSNYLLSVLWVPSILPPGIFNFGKVFNTAGFVSEFQVFAASGVSCKLCVPEDMNAFHPRWYKTCSEKTWV